MAYSGRKIVSGHTALLAEIRNWLTGDPQTPGRDWTVVREDAQTYGTSLILRNTGLSGTEELFIGLYMATYTDNVKGGLLCKVYKAFDAAAESEGGTAFFDTDFGNSNGGQNTCAFVPCWNAAVHVWIWSSQARVILSINCNGLYGSAYLGQLTRFSLPSENPWPLVCFTDGFTNLWANTTWHDSAVLPGSSSNADAGRRSIAFVRRGCSPVGVYTNLHGCHQICRPDGVWTSDFALIPTTSRTRGYATEANIDTTGIPFSIPEGGVRVLMPVYVKLSGVQGGNQVLGQLEGVWWCPDARAATESIVTDNGRSAIIFPDVNRTEWHSFMAIGE